MTDSPRLGVVVDTMVSWLFDDRRIRLLTSTGSLIGDAPVILAFHTVMELRSARCAPGGARLATAVSSAASRN
jgi:hypothetical protein